MPEIALRFQFAVRHARRTSARSAAAWLRLTWHDFIVHALLNRGGERCQECGRSYLLWMAPDELYVEVHGNSGGNLCPRCFRRAAGRRLVWVPFIWDLDDRTDIKARVNGADWHGRTSEGAE